MAYELVAEVFDHAPEGMDPTCRVILLCIAEQCRRPRGSTVPARMVQFPSELMRKRAGVDERGLRHALNRLRDRYGMAVRVAIKLDRLGKPVYAQPGQTCTWVLPPLPVPPDCDCQRCSEQADADVLLPDEEDLQVRGGGPETSQGGHPSPAGGHPSPPPHTVPETRGEGALSPRPQEPPHRCPRHQNDPDPGPCGPCGDARRAHDRWRADDERWERERAEHDRTAARCTTHPAQLAHRCPSCRSEQLTSAPAEETALPGAQARAQMRVVTAASTKLSANRRATAPVEPVNLNGGPLAVGGQLTATIDATGAAVTVTRTDPDSWRVTATRLGTPLYGATSHPDEASARALARSYCEELRQVRAGRKLTRSPITVTHSP